MNLPHCPKCQSNLTYEDGDMLNCPECFHEWAKAEQSEMAIEDEGVRDAYGNLLVNGDSITIIKDLKSKGSSSTLKSGTKIKNIRLIEGDHNIDCKIDGIGGLQLKSEFVKKVTP